MLITADSKKKTILYCILCIHYLIYFWKSGDNIKTLIDFSSKILIEPNSKINITTYTYTLKLGFWVLKTNIKAQLIDKSSLIIYRIVVIVFQGYDKLEQFRFFPKTFLLVNTSIIIMIEILFLFLNKLNIIFAEYKLIWDFYTIAKLLLTI